MEIYNWFKIFNLSDFLDTELVSQKFNFSLSGVGDSEFTAVLGNVVSLIYLDECMPVNMYPEQLYQKNNYAIYRDDLTGDVWFGFLVEE